ncbi:MAG: outer membrane lipoprotein chaperone LolA [Gammaproteobacteria bacterium]|nr:outer membrane lipoprotein chaperone LolA [Gammaproteobacteria bacterium]
MMPRFARLAGAWLLSLFCTAVLADAAGRLDAYLSGLDTVSSQFEQRLFDERRNLLEQARGTVLIDRPGRFRFDYTDPPQLIVGDGTRIWIYDPDLAQVMVRDVDAALGSTPAVLLSTDRPVEEGFRVETLDAGENVDVFALEPKAEDATFSRIRLAFAGGELRRMELVDQFGQTTLLTFREVRREPAIPADAFTFTPPAGVDVIDDDG